MPTGCGAVLQYSGNTALYILQLYSALHSTALYNPPQVATLVPPRNEDNRLPVATGDWNLLKTLQAQGGRDPPWKKVAPRGVP